MRILYLCNSLYFSGAERETLRAIVMEAEASCVLSGLPGLNHMAEAYRRLRPSHKLEVRDLPMSCSKLRRKWTFAIESIKASRAKDIDYVIVSNLRGAGIAAVARILGGAGWIWYIHDYLDNRGLLRRIASRLLFLSCSGWIAVSKDICRVARRLSGNNKIGATVYNCVNAAQGSLSGTDKRIPISEAVLFVGSINSWKGLHTLVHGLACVRMQNGTAPRVDVVGQVVDPLYWETVKTTAAANNLKLRYLGMRDDVPLLMRDYAVLLHPTPAPEPFGLVVAEAILAGCFVISSAMGGVRELLPPEMLECSFDPRCPGSLVSAMKVYEDAQVRYWRRRNEVISELTDMTSEKVYLQLLNRFFDSVAGRPVPA